MVLATDMAEHFSQLNEIKNTLSSIDADTWKLIALGKAKYPEQLEKPKIMSLMIHAADISNALKPWHFSHYSTMQLLQEFFTQGDMCKMNRMPPSPLCDRKTTKIPGSQISFSKFLVLPTFELLTSKSFYQILALSEHQACTCQTRGHKAGFRIDASSLAIALKLSIPLSESPTQQALVSNPF